MVKAEDFIKSILSDEAWGGIELCLLCDTGFDRMSAYCKDGLCEDCSLMMYPHIQSAKTKSSKTKEVDVSGVRLASEVAEEFNECQTDDELIKSWDEQSAEIEDNLAWTHGPWSLGMDY